MAANTSPIFLKQPHVETAASGLNANTALDGSGTIVTVFTADATNGSKIEQVKVLHLGTNIASVLRFFVDHTGSGSWKLIHEETMASNSLSQTAASVPVYVPLSLVMDAGTKLGITIGTAVASGYQVTAIGGDY